VSSLIPRVTVIEAGNATALYIPDTTGEYNADDNTGGYGTPNPESSAITSAQLVLAFDKNGTVVLDFTVSVGSPTGAIVTSMTKTDQLGNIEDLDPSDYNVSAFPFPEDNPPEYPVTLFITDGTVFPDQYVNVTYTVSDGTETEQTSVNWLLDKVACCCMQKAWLKHAAGECSAQNPVKIQNAINGLHAENAVGNITAARKELILLAKLCAACGCGC
jgi:hypothetical protein